MSNRLDGTGSTATIVGSTALAYWAAERFVQIGAESEVFAAVFLALERDPDHFQASLLLSALLVEAGLEGLGTAVLEWLGRAGTPIFPEERGYLETERRKLACILGYTRPRTASTANTSIFANDADPVADERAYSEFTRAFLSLAGSVECAWNAARRACGVWGTVLERTGECGSPAEESDYLKARLFVRIADSEALFRAIEDEIRAHIPGQSDLAPFGGIL